MGRGDEEFRGRLAERRPESNRHFVGCAEIARQPPLAV